MNKILSIEEASQYSRIPLKIFKRWIGKRKDGLPVIAYTKKQICIQNSHGEFDKWIGKHSMTSRKLKIAERE